MATNIRNRQLEICSMALQELSSAVFEENHPLDLQVKQLFRQNKSWGSKDRRFYSETIYAYFRWYGWFKQLDQPVSLNITEIAFQLSTVETCEEAMEIFNTNYPEQTFLLEGLLPEGMTTLFDGTNEELMTFIRQQQFRPPVWLRCRQADQLPTLIKELEAMGLKVEAHKTMTLALKVIGRFNIQLLPSYKQGLVEVQDFASQCIGTIAAPRGESHWLDACAGAGGKGLQLSDIRKGKGKITATDLREKALLELRKRFRKARINLVRAFTHDFVKAPLKGAKFDGVIVDAPCSNSGTWRRNPGLRWNFSQKKVEKVAQLQLAILENASESVKPGGTLVYSTCSACTLENAGVVELFLEKHPDFEGAPITHPITRAKVQTSLTLKAELADNDSMFVAKFTRK